MKNIILIIILGVLVGCTNSSSPEVQARNKENLSGKGFYVGTLPSGQSVYRYTIDMGDSEHDHYLYYIDKDQPITINRGVTVSHGKTSSVENRTDVMIDGALYTPKQ